MTYAAAVLFIGLIAMALGWAFHADLLDGVIADLRAENADLTAERNTARGAVQDAYASPLADVVQGPWGGEGA